MSCDFKVGDKVRFELAASPNENFINYPIQPRWIHEKTIDDLIDFGTSKMFMTGIVTVVNEKNIEVHYKNLYDWPFLNHPEALSKPGYLTLEIEVKDKKENKCTCGAIKCGLPFHSDWCDLEFKH